MTQCIVVAAGAGSRLFPITDVFPKIMMPVGKDENPLALHIIEHCKMYGITDFIFCLNKEKGKQVVNFLRDGSQYGVHIKYSFSDEPLGTAGELSLAYIKKLIKTPTIIYYGDTLCTTNLSRLMEIHKKKQAAVSVVVNDEMRISVGYVEDVGGNIVTIKEKPKMSELCEDRSFNIGGILPIFYVEDIDFYAIYCRPNTDVVSDVLPAMMQNDYKLAAYHDKSMFIDLGNFKNLKLAKTWINETFK